MKRIEFKVTTEGVDLGSVDLMYELQHRSLRINDLNGKGYGQSSGHVRAIMLDDTTPITEYIVRGEVTDELISILGEGQHRVVPIIIGTAVYNLLTLPKGQEVPKYKEPKKDKMAKKPYFTDIDGSNPVEPAPATRPRAGRVVLQTRDLTNAMNPANEVEAARDPDPEYFDLNTGRPVEQTQTLGAAIAQATEMVRETRGEEVIREVLREAVRNDIAQANTRLDNFRRAPVTRVTRDQFNELAAQADQAGQADHFTHTNPDGTTIPVQHVGTRRLDEPRAIEDETPEVNVEHTQRRIRRPRV
jgi:hypothetical protein